MSSTTKANAIWPAGSLSPRSRRPFISACTTSLLLAGTGTEMPNE